MDSLHTKIPNVSSQKELAQFIEELLRVYHQNPSWWENRDLPTFLEALAAWVYSMDGYYKNNDLPYDESNISWKNIADILYGATMQE